MNNWECEEKFSNSGKCDWSKGIAVSAMHIMPTDGCACVVPFDAHKSVLILAQDLPDDVRASMENAAVAAAGDLLPSYVATVYVRRRKDKYLKFISGQAKAKTADAALLEAAENALTAATNREKEAADYLADRQNDRKRAEKLLSALREVFVTAEVEPA